MRIASRLLWLLCLVALVAGFASRQRSPVDHLAVGAPSQLGGAQVLVGAAKTSIEPDPDAYGGEWEQDMAACKTLDAAALENLLDTDGLLAHVASFESPWPENPNCLYMGGYGLGPMFPITSWDHEYGLWVRSVAIGDGDDTVVLTVIDGEGYWWDYANKCSDCGFKQLTQELGAELGVDPSGLVFASTHSHTSPDFLGGWGFVPDWYMQQVSDAIRTTVTDAVEAMEPAVLEVGEERAREFNRERRSTYRSAEEQQLTWLRAYVPSVDGSPVRTIATVGAYAAHPVTRDHESGEAHADWPALFERRVEERFGGMGLLFMTGLGNMSPAGGTDIGVFLADLIPDVGSGHSLSSADVRSTRVTWDHPATNVPLSTLGIAGLFDRKFNPVPATVATGKSPDTAPCLSASAYSVEVPVGAIRIGDDFALTTAPGEIFSNFSNTVKEKSGALVTMPLGQSMDALGYMPQDFEMSPIGQQGLGFVFDGYVLVNYEDSYAIDRCFGDKALETSLTLLESLGQASPSVPTATAPPTSSAPPQSSNTETSQVAAPPVTNAASGGGALPATGGDFMFLLAGCAAVAAIALRRRSLRGDGVEHVEARRPSGGT